MCRPFGMTMESGSSWRWPGETLSDLIADTLPEPACIQTCLPSAEDLTYKTALAQLFVQGHLKVEGEPILFPSLHSEKLANPTESPRHSHYERWNLACRVQPGIPASRFHPFHSWTGLTCPRRGA